MLLKDMLFWGDMLLLKELLPLGLMNLMMAVEANESDDNVLPSGYSNRRHGNDDDVDVDFM